MDVSQFSTKKQWTALAYCLSICFHSNDPNFSLPMELRLLLLQHMGQLDLASLGISRVDRRSYRSPLVISIKFLRPLSGSFRFKFFNFFADASPVYFTIWGDDSIAVSPDCYMEYVMCTFKQVDGDTLIEPCEEDHCPISFNEVNHLIHGYLPLVRFIKKNQLLE